MGWENKTPDSSRHKRAETRKRRRIEESEPAQEVETEGVEEEIEAEDNGDGCQSCANWKDLAEKNAEEISSLKEEIQSLKEQTSSLETQVTGLTKRLNAISLNAPECLEENKSKLKFYTGA